MKNSLICLAMILVFISTDMPQSLRRSKRGAAPSQPSVIYGSPGPSAHRQVASPRKGIKIAKAAESPTLNGDGTKMTFIGKNSTIWIKDIGKNILREVSSQYQAAELSWSPDGKLIAFARYGLWQKDPIRNLNGELIYPQAPLSIWVIDINGKNARQLIEPTPEGDQWPCWSPDGKSIVLSHGHELWIVDSDGLNARPLTLKPAKAYEYCGQWSPRANLLAYLAIDDHADEGYRIWTIDPIGKRQTMLSLGITADKVKWSRDGKFLYYMSREGTSYSGPVPNYIMKIDLDGHKPAQDLTVLPYTTGNFDISPDERWIVYDVIPERNGGGSQSSAPSPSPAIYIKRLPRARRQKVLHN